MIKNKGLIAAIVLGSSISAQASTDSQFVISDIEIEGLQRVALGAVLTYVPVKIGDELNDFRVAQVVKSLYKSTHFERIEVLRNGTKLVIKVKERPTISNIEFSGNKGIKDEQLNDSLLSSGIVVGEPLDKTIVSTVETSLKDFFYSIGKYNAEIDVVITPLPRNRVDIKINFDEGDAAEIAQINVVGNERFPDKELLDQFELKFDRPWWDFLTDTKYQKQKLSGDIETLRSYYMDRGYVRYSLESTQVSMTPNKDGVYITLNVHEGEQYKLKDIELVGDLLGHEDVVEKIIPLRNGDMYNLADVTYTEEMISKYLGRFGYAFPQVTTVPEIDDDNKEVSLTISVNPGKRVYVRRINFNGNSSTSDEVLRRELRQMEGAWLSNLSLDASKSKISRLNYIEEVDFETIKIPGEDDVVDVDFNIKEQSSGTFNIGVGYGSQSKLSFQAGVQQENFLGTGKRIGFNINTVYYAKNLSVSYTDPYFTIDGVSLGGVLSYSDFDAGNANLVEYKSKTVALGGTLGIPVNEINRLNFGLTYKNSDIQQRTSYEQIKDFYTIYADPSNPDDTINLENVEVSAGWYRSNLNRGLFPTAGNSQRLSLKATIPSSDATYYKVDFDTKFYWPLSRDHKWAFLTRVRLGYGNGYGEKDGHDQILPFTENFRAGGPDTMRGFENNTVGPRAIYRNSYQIPGSPDLGHNDTNVGGDGNVGLGSSYDSVTVSRRSVGGNALVVGGVEFIVPTPIIDDEFSNSVRTSLFVDVGNVWDTEFNLDDYRGLSDSEFSKIGDYGDSSAFRASAGLSVQWISPMGPMIFSLANTLRSEEGDDDRFFTFNIGNTF